MQKIKILFFIFSIFCSATSNGISIQDAQEMENNSKTSLQSTDQGSISKERWENFLKINYNFESYKKNLENISTNFEKHVDLLYFKSIRDLIKEYYTSLIILEKYEPQYFYEIFNNKSSELTYNETIKELETLFLQIINKSFFNYLKYYFINNPNFLNEIEFNFWAKAYWPSANSQHVAGFESAHYLKNSVNKTLDYSIFNEFLIKGDLNNYDFMQNDVVFGEYWNSASLKPWIKKSKNPVYYKFKFNKNTQIIKKYLIFNFDVSEKEIEKFSIKITKNKLILNIINFKTKIFEILLNFNMDINKNKSLKENLEQKIKFDIPSFLVNTIKINYKNTCLSKIDSRHSGYKECVQLDDSQEWLIYPVNSKFTEFKIYSAAESGKCLENKLGYKILISNCINNNNNQIWFFSKDSKNKKIIRNLESKKILGSTNYVTSKITRESLLIASFLSKYKPYSKNDWENGVMISEEIYFILYISLYFNKYKVANSSIDFLRLVSEKSWFTSLSPTTQNIINKLINVYNFEIKDDLILELFNDIKSKKNFINKIDGYINYGDFYFFYNAITNEKEIFISKFSGSLKFNIIEIPKNKTSNSNFIYFASYPVYFSDEFVIEYINLLYTLKYQDIISKIILTNNENKVSVLKNLFLKKSDILNKSASILSKINGYKENNNEINSILNSLNFDNFGYIINDPIYENLPYQRVENSMFRFFQLVEDNDGYLLNHNEFRVPTYREVWNRWIQQEWSPPQEFEEIYHQIQSEIEGSSQDLFDRLFDDFQNYWIEQLLNRYERQEQGIQISGNSSEMSSGYDDIYPVSMRSEDSGLSSDISQEFMPVEEEGNNVEFLENIEMLEEVNNIEMLFEVINVSVATLEENIQSLNELIISENALSTITLSTVLPTLIIP